MFIEVISSTTTCDSLNSTSLQHAPARKIAMSVSYHVIVLRTVPTFINLALTSLRSATVHEKQTRYTLIHKYYPLADVLSQWGC